MVHRSSAPSRGRLSADYGYGRAPHIQTKQRVLPVSDPHHRPAVLRHRTASPLSQTGAQEAHSAPSHRFWSAPAQSAQRPPQTAPPPHAPEEHDVSSTAVKMEEGKSRPFHMHPASESFLRFCHIPLKNKCRFSPSDSIQTPDAPPSRDYR